MLWNVIFGAVAGYLTPILEPHIRRIVENLAQAEVPIGRTEFDMMSLLILLMLAAIIVAILGGDSMAFPLCVGAFLGLFGKQIFQAVVNPGKQAANPGTGAPYAAPPRDGEGDTSDDEPRP